MKASAAVARLPRGATIARANETRRDRDSGTEQPAKLALRREQHPGLSDYPSGA